MLRQKPAPCRADDHANAATPRYYTDPKGNPPCTSSNPGQNSRPLRLQRDLKALHERIESAPNGRSTDPGLPRQTRSACWSTRNTDGAGQGAAGEAVGVEVPAQAQRAAPRSHRATAGPRGLDRRTCETEPAVTWLRRWAETLITRGCHRSSGKEPGWPGALAHPQPAGKATACATGACRAINERAARPGPTATAVTQCDERLRQDRIC